jgi:hypothetical protein
VRKLLVIGCGRSGTRYASKVFRAVGLDVGHEEDGRDGRIDWKCVHSPPEVFGGYSLVLHQVRHPLRVIESFHSASKGSWGWVARADPGIVSRPLLRSCARYWVRWNLAAEEEADWTYKVEDLIGVLPRIMESCGLDPSFVDMPSVLGIPATDHTRRGTEKYGSRIPLLTVDRLRECAPEEVVEILRMAVRYGYDLS